MTLDDMQKRAFNNAKAKGFHDDPRSREAALMLILTEVAEAAEEVRRPDFDPKAVRYRDDGKPEGLGPELADIVIRCGDTAEAFGHDLYEQGPASSPDFAGGMWRSGLYLDALWMAAAQTVDDNLDIVVNVCFAIAEACGLDLWALIEEKMDYNEGRPHMHGKRA